MGRRARKGESIWLGCALGDLRWCHFLPWFCHLRCCRRSGVLVV